MTTQDQTRERIIRAARDLFIEQGIRKTSMEDVAHGAGVSRVTVYRHYGDRKDLVRAVIMQAADVFVRISAFVDNSAPTAPDVILGMFQTELGKLNGVSLLGKFDELSRVYPDLFDEYRAIRKHALDSIFSRVLTTLKRGGLLRKGINETVLRHLFFDAIVNAVENPELAGLNMPREQVLGTIREVLLYGIIGPRAASGAKPGRSAQGA
jgi:AcrR family transcriptional regulator